MSTTAGPPHLNGDSVVPAEVSREIKFLEQILQIRDDVLASKHPRIHLPSKVLDHVAPRPPQTSSPSRPTANGTPSGTHPAQLFPPRTDSSRQHPTPPNGFVSPVPPTQRPFSAKSASSGIDPILLTKSDNLIKAELQLKRQQIERALKDAFDKKGRNNDAEDQQPRFDVEGAFTQALSLVKPMSGLRLTAPNSDGGDSFDENSYYSSKADSWSSEELDTSPRARDGAAGSFTSKQKSRAEGQATTKKPSQPSHTGDPVIDLDEEPYEPADDIDIYEPETMGLADDSEESDYSPPPADIGLSEPSRGRPRDRGFERRGGMNGSRRQSPPGPPPPIQNPRKRRREERKEERRRQQASKRTNRSPEPYIKEEPQSPPAFSSFAEPQASKRRALQPLYNDSEVVSAREGSRTRSLYYREQDHSRSLRDYDEPLSPIARIPQRRDDQDLRRLASLQFARRPQSPGGDLYAAPESRQLRAASYAFADRHIDQPRYREASVRPSAAPRYVRERSLSPGIEYVPRAQSPTAMAPPAGRIVVDQHGNRYLAATLDARESVAPPSRRAEVDPYYERAITREPTMRAPLYDEDDMYRMPPPPPRRFLEASDTEMVETRPYRQRELSHQVEYRPQEVMERRPVSQYEEMGPPREYVRSRAFSVRPEAVRRDIPEGYVRHESMQPGPVRGAPQYREASMARQDPYNGPRYSFATTQDSRRYHDDGAMERPVEVSQDPYGVEPRQIRYRY